METKNEITHIEEQSSQNTDTTHVKLLSTDGTILIPQPTADPNDPLNLPTWRKWAILVLVSAYGCTAVVLASGLGPIFPMVKASYPDSGTKTNDLMTYPTRLMGLGNLISMPIAMAAGRRIVFLASIVIMIAGGLWCSLSTSLDSHIAGRAIMSLAAGQSEALDPLMVREIFFIHEKGNKLGWFIIIQNVTCGAFFIMSTYLVAAFGSKWWYGLFTIMNTVILIFSVVFVSETSYGDRDEKDHSPVVQADHDQETDGKDHQNVATTKSRPVLDPATYGPRTWKADLRLLSPEQKWSILPTFYKQVLQGLCVPSILWLLLLNGAFLGIYIFKAGTFMDLGSVQAGQIVVCLLFLPLLGYGSDLTIRSMSRRNNGEYKPGYRLITLGIPSAVGLVCAIIYGQVRAHPNDWSVAAPIVTYNASFFAFLGANIVGITYAVDSFPSRAEAFLVVICAGRGIMSFGISYATLPSITAIGYDGAMNIQGGLAAGFSALATICYYIGPRLRKSTNKALEIE